MWRWPNAPDSIRTFSTFASLVVQQTTSDRGRKAMSTVLFIGFLSFIRIN